MKKTFLTLAAVAMAITASAEGYQVNTLSTNQIAMGHTGVALKLGSESMYFNPAGMAFMQKTIDISAGITAISSFPSCVAENFKHEITKYEGANKISTPLYAYAGFRVYDNLKAGVAFYTPYGSGIEWGIDWPGAALSQQVDLKAFTVQPTFSWKILPTLSVGAGLTISWGKVDMQKGLVSPTSLDLVLQSQGMPALFNDITPASIRLQGTSRLAFGFNAGAMFDISPKVTVGASFRSKVGLKVEKGEASISYANKTARDLLESKIGLINSANFAAEMPMPYTLTFGFSYRPMKSLELAFDAQLTGWKAYKQLDISFLGEEVKAFNQHIEKNYKNSWAFRIGGKYSLTNRFDVRAGFFVDCSPVNKKYYNPETPGMTRISPSLGVSFRPVQSFSINAACAYIAGLGADYASCTYPDLLLQKLSKFEGNYKVRAWVPTIGVSYSF